MNRKTLGLGIATVLTVAMLSTSAFALTVFGNNSQKGSLLIYPRIQVGSPTAFPIGGGFVDTLITLTNDSSLPVLLKCYYATSDPVPTPNSAPASGLRGLKHFEDFTLNLTENQSVAWSASSGAAWQGSQKFTGFVAPPFGIFPDGTTRTAGELKCWAITDDGSTQKSHNHLYGTASVINEATMQAYEYTAWAFQSMGAPESASASPGVLNLNNADYDACPNILLGNFYAGDGLTFSPNTQVTLASCNQDLRQAYTPTITKLTWTFFNQDENARTGVHTCADSWFEELFPTTGGGFTTLTGLGTYFGYFRIQTTADTQICGPDAKTSAYVGVIAQSNGPGLLRGTNLTGRGPANGVIKYDVSPPDGSRPSH